MDDKLIFLLTSLKNVRAGVNFILINMLIDKLIDSSSDLLIDLMTDLLID